MNLTAGTVLKNGRYVCDSQLSQGVFGITVRATDKQSGQAVIIKTLSENLCQHPEFDRFKQQFLEIGDRLKSCKHPHLVRVLGCFEQMGRPYLVMEYIPGQTLAEIIPSKGLSPAKAVKYIRQIGQALNVLHEVGLLHSDIKPQNIIRRQDTDSVMLCEFGFTCEFTPGVMQTHANLLSAGYAPLEQYAYEERRTCATDIYALAATFYCLLTGCPPLPAPIRQTLHAGEKASAATSQEHRSFSQDLQEALRNLNPALRQAIFQGLELAAERRTQTIDDWLSLLPKPQKAPTTKPVPAARPATISAGSRGTLPQQDWAGTAVNPTLEKHQIPQPTTSEKIPTPQPELGQHFVVKSKLSTATWPQHTATQAAVKPTPEKYQTSQPSLKKKPIPPFRLVHSSGTKLRLPNVGLPLRALLMTGAIAASAGVGFGFALRINTPNEPGSTILHTKQSFPPRSNWPVSEPPL